MQSFDNTYIGGSLRVLGHRAACSITSLNKYLWNTHLFRAPMQQVQHWPRHSVFCLLLAYFYDFLYVSLLSYKPYNCAQAILPYDAGQRVNNRFAAPVSLSMPCNMYVLYVCTVRYVASFKHVLMMADGGWHNYTSIYTTIESWEKSSN